MIKKLLFLSLVFLSTGGFSQQTDTAFVFYEAGLKAFNEKNFHTADSLYTISLKYKQHPDTYYNRALARIVLMDTTGYCEDICYSGAMGDKECDTIFRKECGHADTVFTDKNNKPATRLHHEYLTVVYRSIYPKANIAVKFHRKIFAGSVNLEPEPRTYTMTQAEMLPEFRGGEEKLNAFIKTNLKYPEAARLKKISGQVTVRFIVNQLGYLENIVLLKGMDNCPSCNKEALRVVYAMPNWKPGARMGKPERCYYILPLNFKPLK